MYLKKVTGMQPFRMALNSRVVSWVAPGAHTQKRDLAMSASVSCTGSTMVISTAAPVPVHPEQSLYRKSGTVTSDLIHTHVAPSQDMCQRCLAFVCT